MNKKYVMSIMRLCFCRVVFFGLSSSFGAVFPELQVTLGAQGTSFYKLSFLFHDIFQSNSRVGEYLAEGSISLVLAIQTRRLPTHL